MVGGDQHLVAAADIADIVDQLALIFQPGGVVCVMAEIALEQDHTCWPHGFEKAFVLVAQLGCRLQSQKYVVANAGEVHGCACFLTKSPHSSTYDLLERKI